MVPSSLLFLGLCTALVTAVPRVRPPVTPVGEAAVETTDIDNATATANSLEHYSNSSSAEHFPTTPDSTQNIGPSLTIPNDHERRGVEIKPPPVKLSTKKSNSRSTSSSSGEKNKKEGSESESENKESLALSGSATSSESASKEGKVTKKDKDPKSTVERHGWRKWHRKCYSCPEQMKMKWRDPRIKWICGVYQRARRSFKSACMMRYRNCQDGTMFVKLHSKRCHNDTGKDSQPHGEHFMYEYNVKLSDDTSESGSGSDESSSSSSSSSSKNK